jgi:transposase
VTSPAPVVRRCGGKTTWGKAHMAHMAWLAGQKLAHLEQRIALEEMLHAVRQAGDRIARLEHAIHTAVPDWSLAASATALMALRGIEFIAATTLLAEIGDLTRFRTPRELMAWLGMVPSEHSTGERVRRGAITKPGTGEHAASWWNAPGAIAIRRGSAATSWRGSRRRRLRCVTSPGRRSRG